MARTRRINRQATMPFSILLSLIGFFLLSNFGNAFKLQVNEDIHLIKLQWQEPLARMLTINSASKQIDTVSNDLEEKVQELLMINLELKEKGQRYDSLEKCSSANEAKIESLRSQLQQQISLFDSSTV